jgi:hypothetical protein
MFYELTPAYGHDYKTKAEVTAAWESGKDFNGDFQLGFALVNKQDVPKPCTVLLRYKGSRSVASVKVTA